MAGRFVDGGTLTGVDQRPTNKFQPASIPRLRAGDLSHSPCMSSSFKRSCNKSIEHFFRVLFADETGGNAEYISVVVLADKLGNFIAPADAGTDILMFVGSNCYTISAATEKNSESIFSAFYSRSHGMGIIRIVNRVF